MRYGEYWYELLTALYLRRKGVKWKGKVPVINLKSRPVFMVYGKLELGYGVEFLTPTIRTRIQVDKGATLRIGDRVIFNDTYIVRASTDLDIGSNAGIGPFVSIRDDNYHEIFPGCERGPKPVRIGKNCYIGEKSIILPGVTIGDHSFIGAGSVVTKPIPEKVIAAGNPARIIRPFVCADDWVRER